VPQTNVSSEATSEVEDAPAISLEHDTPELAQAYEQLSTRQFNHGKVLVAALRLKSGEQVLDVGCGTGRLGEHVARGLGPTGSVVGIDPLPLRIAIARGRHPNLHVQVGRAEDLSCFAAGRFSAAYLNSVLHWIPDKHIALSQVLRVLAPAGRIAVNCADADRPHQSGALVRQALDEEGLTDAARASARGLNYRVTARELARLLRQAGFVNVQVQARTFVDLIDDVDDVFAWSSSSSFGNFLSDLDEAQRARVRARLADKLESLRTETGIELERYLVFATAQKG